MCYLTEAVVCHQDRERWIEHTWENQERTKVTKGERNGDISGDFQRERDRYRDERSVKRDRIITERKLEVKYRSSKGTD